jgi:hypothetical protein
MDVNMPIHPSGAHFPCTQHHFRAHYLCFSQRMKSGRVPLRPWRSVQHAINRLPPSSKQRMTMNSPTLMPSSTRCAKCSVCNAVLLLQYTSPQACSPSSPSFLGGVDSSSHHSAITDSVYVKQDAVTIAVKMCILLILASFLVTSLHLSAEQAPKTNSRMCNLESCNIRCDRQLHLLQAPC